ncbi:hypothetical protein [Prochlorothrix hollandica]|uniref:hypothetical protein n=1 Tax=Prochlorothrix hollandica TaxID=1223 RepID=UPI00034ABDB1|nr:hypothetical protein [Prochlorothrix hollandica]
MAICLCYYDNHGFTRWDYYEKYENESTGKSAFFSLMGTQLTWKLLQGLRGQHPTALVCTEKYANTQEDIATEKTYSVGIVQQITEDDFNYLCCVLPPIDFDAIGFTVAEPISHYKDGNLFTRCLIHREKYFKMIWHDPNWREMIRKKVGEGDFIPLDQ